MTTATRKRRVKGKKPAKQTAVIDDSTWLLISYRRFSSDRQKHGRSQDRQNEAWDTFVEAEKREHPDRTYIYDSLPMDKGMSALYGEHRKRGHLGKFVTGIESGNIKVIPGRTILFIEEVRRLSREGSKDALQYTIFKLFDAGITIQFASGLKFSNEFNKKTMGWLGVLTTLLDLAYEESRQKRDWLSDVWNSKRKRARETNEAVAGNFPYWLEIVGRTYIGDKVDKPGEYELIPKAAKAVVKMFELARDGLGYDLIQQHLDHNTQTKKAWVPPKRKNQEKQEWRRSYIRLTLRNRAVIGEYQPHRKVGGKYGKRIAEGQPISNFYPNVLKDHPGLFELVQQKLASKHGTSQSGANKTFSNVLTGLVKCGYCGGPMHYGPKGPRARKNRNYLYCGNSSGRKPPRCPMIQYNDCKTVLLEKLRRLKPEQVLPKKNKQAKLCEKLRQDEKQTIAKIDGIDEQIANYVAMIGRTKDAELQNEYERLAIELRSKKRDAGKDLAEVRSRLQDSERDTKSVEVWQSEMARLHAELDKDPEVRARLNNHLRQYISHIDVFAKGYPDDFRDGSDGNALYHFDEGEYEALHQGGKPKKVAPQQRKEWKAFESWAMARLQTKHARFLRVYFKQHGLIEENGLLRLIYPFIDIAPEGSVGGLTAIDTLHEEFKSNTKRPRPR